MPAKKRARYVAFIRAINGSPHNRIKMTDLAQILEKAKCQNVSWYLQTGNLFLEAAGSMESIAQGIEAELVEAGLQKADVMLRTTDQLDQLVRLQPFRNLSSDDYKFCVSFLRSPPKATPLEKLHKESVIVCHQDETVVCSAVPIAAKLSGGISTVIDKPWGTPTTTRWWHVVEEVASLSKTK
jgi:uncharacterized protein (DUF1697 family)